ncbi:MAG: DUF3037 domain-containing protein [Chloroflexota bacterium]
MPRPSSFDYAIIRLVPRVEREEFMNVGAILFCRTRRFLAAQIALDSAKMAVFAPQLDKTRVEAQLALIPRICAGEESPIGQLSQAERFHWLVNPRSTVVQMSAVHSGLCDDPAEALARLVAQMVKGV